MDFRYRNGAMPKRHFETPAALPADAFFGEKFMTHVSPNENKMSDGGRARASLGGGSVEVISKVERTAVRRSLHRMVRRFHWSQKCVHR